MSWAVGEFNGRDIGYGVPSLCDHPGCGKEIDRGLAYVCGSEPYGGEHGCGLFFCDAHLRHAERRSTDGALNWPNLCHRCRRREPAYDPTPDVEEWIQHKATDPSWAKWRAEQASPSSCGGGAEAVTKQQEMPRDHAWIKDGVAVWYAVSPGLNYTFAGVVDGEPRLLGEHTWVVRLREMEPRYRDGARSTVPAAACFALSPRSEEGEKREDGP